MRVVSGWPTGVAAVTLFVEDVTVSREFYERAVGLPLLYADDVSAVYAFGGTLVNLLARSEAAELIDPAPVGTSGARMQLTVHVEDVDAVCAEVTGRGVALLNGPMDRPWGVRTAAFADPDGHVWEIAH